MLIVAALCERDRSGEPREIELNQLSATVALIGVEWLQYATTGEPPPPCSNRDVNWCPHGVFPALGDDEWIALAVDGDETFAALCSIMGDARLAADPRFSTHSDRKRHEELRQLVDLSDAEIKELRAAGIVTNEPEH
jgi:benzylsuccinate CoA-transferase BbsF subunit